MQWSDGVPCQLLVQGWLWPIGGSQLTWGVRLLRRKDHIYPSHPRHPRKLIWAGATEMLWLGSCTGVHGLHRQTWPEEQTEPTEPQIHPLALLSPCLIPYCLGEYRRLQDPNFWATTWIPVPRKNLYREPKPLGKVFSPRDLACHEGLYRTDERVLNKWGVKALMLVCICVGKRESLSVCIPHLKYCHVLGSADAQQCLPVYVKQSCQLRI